LKPAPLLREHRLYQADWLMRYYGFAAEEITTSERPELSLDVDPKTTWAKEHPEFFPVDVNCAVRESLLRVPGIGYRNVERILRIRRHHRLTLNDLRKLHVRVSAAREFVVTADHLPGVQVNSGAASLPAQQLELFAAASALSGAF
jgi:predicted DNA-binding helix-hairpin-helix protein